MVRIRLYAAALLPLLAAAPAYAQEEEPAPEFEPAGLPGSGVDVAFEADLLSDYRFRGVSRSDEEPALRAQVTVGHDSGFYAGARAITIDGRDGFRMRDPAFVDLGDVELDLFAGYGTDLGGGFDVDAGILYYAFAGGEGATDYVEPYAALSYLIGPVYATAGAKYAPGQRAIGGEDMLHLFGQADVSVPLTPLRFSFQAGRQDWGRYGGYWNWSIGGRYAVGPGEVAIHFVDTDLPSAHGRDGGLVFSAGLRF